MLPPAAAPSSAHPQPGASFPGSLVPGYAGLTDPFGKPSVPPAMQTTFDPWALMQALQRRWLLASILGLLVTAGAVAGAYWFLWEPERKEAKAIAYVWPTPQFIYDRHPEEPEGSLLARLKMEAQIAVSGEVVTRALQDPDLEKLEDFANLTEQERVNWLMNGGRFGAYPYAADGTVVIVVSSTDNDRWLVPIANALLRAYLSYTNELELAARQQQIDDKHDLFMKNGGDTAAELEALREKQRQLEAANPGVLDQRKSLLTQLQEADSERSKIIAEMERIKIDMEVRREELGDTTVTRQDIEVELEADEKLQEMLVELAELQEDIEKGAARFEDGKDNPIIKNLVLQLSQYEEEKDAYIKQRTQEITDSLTAKRQGEIQVALVEFTRNLARQERYLKLARERISTLTTRLSLLQDPTVDTQALEADLKGYEPYYSRLRDELNRLRREQGAPPRVTQKQEAAIEAKPQTPPYRKVAMAGFGALAVVLAGISLLEHRIRRIHTVNEVVQGLGLRLLGAIPAWSPNSQQRSGYGTTLAYNLWTESVDTARTMVTHAAQAESARVVMVTSATSGEGKTSLASHLASSLARAGHRTLLVDGDLRSPAIHVLFDVELAPGLCEVLRGQIALDQAVQATPAGGLSLLTAGQWDSSALQALAQGSAQDIFAQLKEQFDYVIVDSSPVLAVADALMIGRHVDGVLLSILRDVSRVPTVYAAYQRLTMLGIRTLGAVVNGARSEQYGSWYNAAPTAA